MLQSLLQTGAALKLDCVCNYGLKEVPFEQRMTPHPIGQGKTLETAAVFNADTARAVLRSQNKV